MTKLGGCTLKMAPSHSVERYRSNVTRELPLAGTVNTGLLATPAGTLAPALYVPLLPKYKEYVPVLAFKALTFHLMVVSYGLPKPPCALPVRFLTFQPVGSVPASMPSLASGDLAEQHVGDTDTLLQVPAAHVSVVQLSASSQSLSTMQQPATLA